MKYHGCILVVESDKEEEEEQPQTAVTNEPVETIEVAQGLIESS